MPFSWLEQLQMFCLRAGRCCQFFLAIPVWKSFALCFDPMIFLFKQYQMFEVIKPFWLLSVLLLARALVPLMDCMMALSIYFFTALA